MIPVWGVDHWWLVEGCFFRQKRQFPVSASSFPLQSLCDVLLAGQGGAEPAGGEHCWSVPVAQGQGLSGPVLGFWGGV